MLSSTRLKQMEPPDAGTGSNMQKCRDYPTCRDLSNSESSLLRKHYLQIRMQPRLGITRFCWVPNDLLTPMHSSSLTTQERCRRSEVTGTYLTFRPSKESI